jgi:hypothetical protein
VKIKQTLYKVLNSFLNLCNRFILFVTKYPALILCLFLAIAFATLVLLINNKFNVGGILGKVLGLFGIGKDKNTITPSNTIPPDRKQVIGEADERGYVQHKVSELETSANPFRDKTVVTLPDGRKVKLPSGVKDTDVDTIIDSGVEVVIVPTEDSRKKLLETQSTIKKAEDTNAKAKDLLARLKERQK